MAYPPQWRCDNDPAVTLSLMREHPFAHLIGAHAGLHATRVPFVVDTEDEKPVRLRAHLNARNPLASGLDGAPVLVLFSGPSTYVSPHWRVSKTRAGTIDFEEVRVRGVVRIVDDIAFFRRFIDDLSELLEPQHAEAGDYPVWTTSMAPEGYIERLYPEITMFEIAVESVETIRKLHQNFDEADRRSVAEHLSRCNRDGSRAIAESIRGQLGD